MADWEKPIEFDEERPVDVDEEDVDAVPHDLPGGIEANEADAVEQAIEVPLDEEEHEA